MRLANAWWVVHDESDFDSRVSRKLVICHGCLPPPRTTDDQVAAFIDPASISNHRKKVW
jgi:hypothetical protein